LRRTDRLLPRPPNRFDARALLDYLPPVTTANSAEAGSLETEINFDRYRDLVDMRRLDVAEEDCLTRIEEEWNDLVKRKLSSQGNDASKPSDEQSESSATAKGKDGSFAAIPYIYEQVPTATPAVDIAEEANQTHEEAIAGGEADNELTTADNIVKIVKHLSAEQKQTLSTIGLEFEIADIVERFLAEKDEQERAIRIELQRKVSADQRNYNGT
jgi:hypothetical protein